MMKPALLCNGEDKSTTVHGPSGRDNSDLVVVDVDGTMPLDQSASSCDHRSNPSKPGTCSTVRVDSSGRQCTNNDTVSSSPVSTIQSVSHNDPNADENKIASGKNFNVRDDADRHCCSLGMKKNVVSGSEFKARVTAPSTEVTSMNSKTNKEKPRKDHVGLLLMANKAVQQQEDERKAMGSTSPEDSDCSTSSSDNIFAEPSERFVAKTNFKKSSSPTTPSMPRTLHQVSSSSSTSWSTTWVSSPSSQCRQRDPKKSIPKPFVTPSPPRRSTMTKSMKRETITKRNLEGKCFSDEHKVSEKNDQTSDTRDSAKYAGAEARGESYLVSPAEKRSDPLTRKKAAASKASPPDAVKLTASSNNAEKKETGEAIPNQVSQEEDNITFEANANTEAMAKGTKEGSFKIIDGSLPLNKKTKTFQPKRVNFKEDVDVVFCDENSSDEGHENKQAHTQKLKSGQQRRQCSNSKNEHSQGKGEDDAKTIKKGKVFTIGPKECEKSAPAVETARDDLCSAQREIQMLRRTVRILAKEKRDLLRKMERMRLEQQLWKREIKRELRLVANLNRTKIHPTDYEDSVLCHPLKRMKLLDSAKDTIEDNKTSCTVGRTEEAAETTATSEELIIENSRNFNNQETTEATPTNEEDIAEESRKNNNKNDEKTEDFCIGEKKQMSIPQQLGSPLKQTRKLDHAQEQARHQKRPKTSGEKAPSAPALQHSNQLNALQNEHQPQSTRQTEIKHVQGMQEKKALSIKPKTTPQKSPTKEQHKQEGPARTQLPTTREAETNQVQRTQEKQTVLSNEATPTPQRNPSKDQHKHEGSERVQLPTSELLKEPQAQIQSNEKEPHQMEATTQPKKAVQGQKMPKPPGRAKSSPKQIKKKARLPRIHPLQNKCSPSSASTTGAFAGAKPFPTKTQASAGFTAPATSTARADRTTSKLISPVNES